MRRIQRKRSAGWKMPPNTIYVGRPTKWGNPFRVGVDGDLATVITKYMGWLTDKLTADPAFLDALNGKDLACWCPLNRLCHVDVLLSVLGEGKKEKKGPEWVEKEAHTEGHKDAAAYLKSGVSIERVDEHLQNSIDAAYNAGWNKAINEFQGHAPTGSRATINPQERGSATAVRVPEKVGADKKGEVKKMALTIEELKGELNGFCGTLQYHRHFTGGKFTDGVKHLADRAGAYWLIDAVFSYQVGKEIRDLPFQIWTLKVLRSELGKNKNEPMAVLEMKEDTDKPLIVSQKIPYTDFPKGEIKLYVQNGVLFLPSEY